MAPARCPICDRPFKIDETPVPPFCSRRCRQIDLARWLGEQYGLPYERSEDEDGEADGSGPDRIA